MTIVTITKDDAETIREKLDILVEDEDQLQDYGLTHELAIQLYASVPLRGGLWHIPAWGIDAVKGEARDLIHPLTTWLKDLA